MVRWVLPSTPGQTSSHVQRVKQLLGVSEKDQSLLPLHHPYSPFMLLAGHSCCGQGRVGVQGRSHCSVQRERGRYALYPASTPACTVRGTETQHEEAQEGTSISYHPSPWCAAGARWLWLLHQVRFLCVCTRWPWLGSSSGISPLP